MKNTTTILLAVILLLSAGTASANPGIISARILIQKPLL